MPTIRAFMASDATIRGLMGPVGGGKSSGCIIELVRRGVSQRPGPDGIRRSRWVVVRSTYRQLADTTMKTFFHWFPPYQFGDWRPSEDTYTVRGIAPKAGEPGADIEFLFRALDRPDQVGNLMSLDLTGGWINEAREPPWAIVEALETRIGRFPAMQDGGPTWQGIIMDTNPPDVDSAWYRFFEEKELPASYRSIFKQPSGRSPLAENRKNLPPGYYERLCQGKSEAWKRIYIDGEYGFTADGKPVFPEYSDPFHCQPCEPVRGRTIYRGFDYGMTPACVFTQMRPNGQWIVFDEMTTESMGFDLFSDDVLDYCAREYPDYTFEDYGDPAGAFGSHGEKTCFQISWSKGIEVQPGLQDPTIRQECIRRPLMRVVGGEPQFLLDPRCKVLRKGFQGGYEFRRMQVTGERFTDKPNKNRFSHPMDALQYVATRLFGSGLLRGEDEGRSDDDDRPFRRGSEHALDDSTRSPVTGY